jgi:hypothetical protein
MSHRWLFAALLPVTLLSVACADDDTPEATHGRFDDQVAETPARSAVDAGPDGRSATGGGFTDDDAPPATDAGPSVNSSPDAGARDAAPPSTNTCQSARDLGGIAADQGDATVSTQGTCTEWVKIRAEEKTAGLIAATMKLQFTLTSPSQANFDLYVHVNKDADVLECSTVTGKSEEPSGRSDVVKVNWGEYYTGNQSPDGRTVSILVKSKTGACDPAKTWNLVIQGNQD